MKSVASVSKTQRSKQRLCSFALNKIVNTQRPKRRPVHTEKPTFPRGPLQAVDITRNSVTLSWFPPSSDGGAAISAYVLERREVSRPTWHKMARVKPHNTTYMATGLSEGAEYVFRVFAENIAGVSLPLTMDGSVLLRRPAG